MATPVDDSTTYRGPNRMGTERTGGRRRIVPRPVPVGLPAGWSGSPLATVIRDTTATGGMGS